jgi:hypothetical protein
MDVIFLMSMEEKPELDRLDLYIQKFIIKQPSFLKTI